MLEGIPQVYNEAEPDPGLKTVDEQVTNSNTTPNAEVGSKETQEQEVKNDAIVKAGSKSVHEQGMKNQGFQPVWKVLEAIAHLVLRKYPKTFYPEVNILTSTMKAHFNAYINELKLYSFLRCLMFPMSDIGLSKAAIFLDHFPEVHTI